MLVEKGNQIYADLSSFAPLTSLLTKGANGIRPLMAEASDGKSFVTYAIRFLGYKTKDNPTDFQVIIWSWADSYNKTVAIADQVELALAASSNFYSYESGTPKYNEQNEIYTEQIFNIKS